MKYYSALPYMTGDELAFLAHVNMFGIESVIETYGKPKRHWIAFHHVHPRSFINKDEALEAASQLYKEIAKKRASLSQPLENQGS